MGNPWTVDPTETEKIELEWVDGETVRKIWLTVKKQLSVGEERTMLKQVSSVSQLMVRKKGDEPERATARIEWAEYSFARAVAYIVDWSLAHDAEKADRLPPTRTSYESLRTDAFEVIDNALDEYETAVKASKKTPAGSPKPAPTSVS